MQEYITPINFNNVDVVSNTKVEVDSKEYSFNLYLNSIGYCICPYGYGECIHRNVSWFKRLWESPLCVYGYDRNIRVFYYVAKQNEKLAIEIATKYSEIFGERSRVELQ